MPDEKPPVGTTEKIEGIPLYLIPKTIADLIRKKGNTVFRILVIRKFHHRYSVHIETFDEHVTQAKKASVFREEGEGDS